MHANQAAKTAGFCNGRRAVRWHSFLSISFSADDLGTQFRRIRGKSNRPQNKNVPTVCIPHSLSYYPEGRNYLKLPVEGGLHLDKHRIYIMIHRFLDVRTGK